MTRQHSRTVVSLAALALVATAGVLSAGPIVPPAGPVTSTLKTLTEVEPRIAVNATNTPGDATSIFRIVAPGSYYLTGSILGAPGKHGIAIAASGVTLDLNGFDLSGSVLGCLSGVSVTVGGQGNIAVINGSVRNWGGKGIDLGTPGASISRVAGVVVSGNLGLGITVGSACVVTNCALAQNSGGGITTGDGCTISNCSVLQSGSMGISTASQCTVTNCAASFNAGGIATGPGCVVSGCSASANNSGGAGIATGIGSTVADCVASSNALDGIACGSQCIIRGNTCANDGVGVGGGAGIHVTGSDNRIEGNNCTQSLRGIDVDAAGNFITKNTCSGSVTNWDVVAGNFCLVVQGVAGAAILGNTGGVAPGSTDPNANFTY